MNVIVFASRKGGSGKSTLAAHLAAHAHKTLKSCLLVDADPRSDVWSLGVVDSGEDDLLRRFFGGLEKLRPTLVSWNGSGFDLPVLHYRMLRHGIASPTYWDTGEDDRDFKWNNYISRYHSRHLDLMDLLALYQGRANAPLSDLAQLMGLPGKLGMDGSEVWGAYQAGKLAEIRNYCETDVVNTYLIYLRFQLMRGVLTEAQLRSQCDLVRATLGNSPGPHWKEFLARWQA